MRSFATRLHRRLSSIVLASSCLLLLSGCGNDGAASVAAAGPGRGGGQGQDAEVPVVTATAQVRTVPITIDAVGTVEAIATVDVRSQVTGQLQQILFEAGQYVRKGQPLFLLDRRPLEAALRQAEAIAAKDAAQADDAEQQRQRLQDLFARGLLPRNQYETQAASAAALKATVESDRAQVEAARLNLQYARIISPIDGRAGALNTHVGDLVRSSDTTALVTINQMAPIYVSFGVPGRLLADIRKRMAQQPLAVTVSEPSQETGTVTFIDNAVDPATATITLKATFANKTRDLWPGLFVPVSVQLATQPDAVVVPATAVQTAQQGQYVYVVKADRTVDMRPVTVDRQQGDTSIIASGLTGGEEVVTEGQLRLTPGARVSTAAAPEPAS